MADEISLTYGHGKLYDFTALGDYADVTTNKSETGCTLSQAIDEGDYLKITATGISGADNGYYENATNIQLAPTAYTKMYYRYKTTATTKASITAVDSSGHTQAILAATNSTDLVEGSVTIAFGDADLLDHIRLGISTADGSVYFDFILVVQNKFTFPHFTRINPDFPDKGSDIVIPSMGGDQSQNLGSKLCKFSFDVDITKGNWQRTGDTVDAQVFYDIWNNSASEPWQWFKFVNTHPDIHFEFKANLRNLGGYFYESNGKLMWHLTFDIVEKRVSSGTNANESHYTRLGMNLS